MVNNIWPSDNNICHQIIMLIQYQETKSKEQIGSIPSKNQYNKQQ